jgi:rhomboid protease GluP
MFLHGGAVHLIVNMITLLDLGRICERFFGRSRFLALYLLSGIAGSVASVYWNPMVNSVGASGAICGILGAMLIYMVDTRNRVPVAMLKSHAAGIGIFMVYSAIMGVGDAPIDHAAHAGGLVAGAVCAVFLSPWWRTSQAVAGSVVMVLVIAGLVRVAPGAAPEVLQARQAQQRFNDDTLWFGTREAELLALAQHRVPQWGKADAKPMLTDLALQWDAVHDRFTAYPFDPASRQGQLQRLLLDYTSQRSRSYRALADMPPKEAREEFERLSAEMKKTVEAINALSRTR